MFFEIFKFVIAVIGLVLIILVVLTYLKSETMTKEKKDLSISLLIVGGVLLIFPYWESIAIKLGDIGIEIHKSYEILVQSIRTLA